MNYRIENIIGKKLVGKKIVMSFAADRTAELWQSFMPRRNEIPGRPGTELISMQVYGKGFFDNFNPDAGFEKWAAVEVEDYSQVPGGFETFDLPGGMYAVFIYRGKASEAGPFYQYIFDTWMTNSSFKLDDRPHFEILGEKYKNEAPDSEEAVWVPVRPVS